MILTYFLLGDNLMSRPKATAARLEELRLRETEARNAGSESARKRQREAGKLLATERVAKLVDPGSFIEADGLACHTASSPYSTVESPYGDGVVTGNAEIEGRPVSIISQDFSVRGGTLGETHGRKILKAMSTATTVGCPFICINESGGARIQEGVVALSYYAQLGAANARSSGIVPQIAIIMGPCAGGAVYSPALMDFIVMVDETSYMFVTGPDVVNSVMGEATTMEELGGALTNNEVSGNAHYLAYNEEDALEWVHSLLSFLPSNNLSEPPIMPVSDSRQFACMPELDVLVPDDPRRPYDIRKVIDAVLDDPEEFLEVQALFAPNMICGFGRIEGKSVGIVANQPLVSAGTLDIDASEKAARFVQFCDTFNIPLLTLVDVPGYQPGTEQERNGIIRRGATLLHAYAQATVPMVTLVVRKAYGGAYAVMGSKHLGADVNLAWPTAEVAVLGPEAAVSVLHRNTLREAAETGAEDRVREDLIEKYKESMLNPYSAAERGYIDQVILPRNTPDVVAKSFRILTNKRSDPFKRKHSNMPI